MDQANYQNEILQAISELSSIVKRMEIDLKALQTTVDSNHKTVMERIDFTEDKLSEEIRKVDRKMLILTNELLETKADVLRIEQTK